MIVRKKGTTYTIGIEDYLFQKNLFKKNNCRDWNCKTCLADIEHVADAYRSNEAFEAIIEGFQGN